MIISTVAKALASGALSFVMNLGAGLFKHAKTDSLVSFTKSTRVEPITLIDQRAMGLPYLHDTLQAVNSIFIGYYMQAVALLVNIGDINVIKLLDTLNPDRDYKDAIGNSYLVDKINPKNTPSLLSMESYTHSLPVPAETASEDDRARMLAANVSKVSMESIGDVVSGKEGVGNLGKQAHDAMTYHSIQKGEKGEPNTMVEKTKNAEIGFDAIKEATNLSVGKLIEVTVQQEQHKATFPIMVRLISTLLSPSVLTHILGDGSRDVTMVERFHGWRSGQLNLWRDIIMAEDLIEERRKALLKDDSGAYAEILRRRSTNAVAGVTSKTPSIGTASNIVILTSQTAKELEASIGGRLSDTHTRKKVFDNTYIMIMVILDTEWEQVTIYHRGINLPTKLSVKELKVANKGSGPDVAEILKAFQLGNQITL